MRCNLLAPLRCDGEQCSESHKNMPKVFTMVYCVQLCLLGGNDMSMYIHVYIHIYIYMYIHVYTYVAHMSEYMDDA